MENSFTKAYLLFLRYVLNIINSFNALFQNKKVLIHQIFEASTNIFKYFCSNYIKSGVLNHNRLKDINVADPINYLPSKKIVFGTEYDDYIKEFPETYDLVKTKCLDFYVTAAIEMKKRLLVYNNMFEQLRFLDPNYALYEYNTNEDCLDIDFKAFIE